MGICGELGADTALTEKFLQMGIDELSVSPSMILHVRKQIRASLAGTDKIKIKTKKQDACVFRTAIV